MKKIFIVVMAAGMAASCNTKPKTDATTTTVPNQDTVGLASYRQWKAQNELNTTTQLQEQSANTANAPARTTSTRKTSASSSRVYRSNSTSSNTAQASSKKGWSKAAKGAVIGGVGGAAAGAIINKKNRAAGAVIGGVLGAGAGYGIGRHKDKKDGRN
ncbi:MAG TPA: glycine zipper domain-containing protein [Flavisolibacter sp.]|nr:glycine zipper domain-containing protein [Flavisolibacter sp.]